MCKMGLCTFRNIKIEESVTEERLNEKKRMKRPRKQAGPPESQ